MNLIPAVVAVRDVSADYAHALSDLRKDEDRWVESGACGTGVAIRRDMLANYFNYQMAVSVYHVYQIQDRFPVRIESEVQVAIGCAAHGNNLASDSRARFDHSQPFRTINMPPQIGVAVSGRQFHGGHARIAQFRGYEPSDKNGQYDQRHSIHW